MASLSFNKKHRNDYRLFIGAFIAGALIMSVACLGTTPPSHQITDEANAISDAPEAEKTEESVSKIIVTSTQFVSKSQEQTETEPVILSTQPVSDLPASNEIFSVSTFSDTAPENIMKEIAFFGQGGGGGGTACEGAIEGKPYVLDSFFEAQLYRYVRLYSCGWEKGERVQISIQYPNGKVSTIEEQALSDTSLVFHMEPSLDDFPGTYQVTSKGKSGVLEQSFELIESSGPGITPVNDHVLLYGFAPNEKVKIYAYESYARNPELIKMGMKNWRRFLGWKEYQVPKSGKLQVQVDPDLTKLDIDYIAVGEISGRPQFSLDPSCQDALTPRVRLGTEARTISEGIQFFNSLDELNPLTLERRQFPLGIRLVILDGPICGNWTIYWLVSLDDGSSGWIAEVDQDDSGVPVYFIEPSDPDSEYTEFTGSISCPGAPPQRVQVGDTAYVCTKSERLRVREGPRRKANEITRISPGTEILIVGGPECANSWSWWKIQTSDGIEGWVAEGGDNVDPYFICPIR